MGGRCWFLRGHTGFVNSVCFSPDGKWLATASHDHTAKIWDAASGQEVLTLRDTNSVMSVCFSPDGKRLVSGGGDYAVKFWDAESGRQLLALQGHTGAVLNVAFSPDGRRLASASGDRTVRIWNTESGQELLTLRGHKDHVRDVVFSHDGGRLISGSDDETVTIWEAAPASGVQTTSRPLVIGENGRARIRKWSRSFKIAPSCFQEGACCSMRNGQNGSPCCISLMRSKTTSIPWARTKRSVGQKIPVFSYPPSCFR